MHLVKAPKGKVTHIATIRDHRTLPNVLMTYCGWNANKKFGWKRTSNRGNTPVCKICLANLKFFLNRLGLRIQENHENSKEVPKMQDQNAPVDRIDPKVP